VTYASTLLQSLDFELCSSVKCSLQNFLVWIINLCIKSVLDRLCNSHKGFVEYSHLIISCYKYSFECLPKLVFSDLLYYIWRITGKHDGKVCSIQKNFSWTRYFMLNYGEVLHYYPRESFREGLWNHRRWFVCLSVCLSVTTITK